MAWLQSVLDILDPGPSPDGATAHLYLDLYRTETDPVQRMLTQPTEQLRKELTPLVQQDVSSARAILRELDAHQQLARLDSTVTHCTDAELADNYPEIRRIIGTSLLDASPDGYRMSASGMHDAMVGERVASASDVLFALTTHIPVPVAHAKRRAVGVPFSRPCDDGVGRFLAVQVAHLPPNARLLEVGTGVGIAIAWLVSGLWPPHRCGHPVGGVGRHAQRGRAHLSVARPCPIRNRRRRDCFG